MTTKSDILVNDARMRETLRRPFAPFMKAKNFDWLTRLVRMVRPRTIVETGVGYGASSYLFLAASEPWGARLFSVDLPLLAPTSIDGRVDRATVSDVTDTGKLVPDGLRDRWELTIGESRHKLPQLLDSLRARNRLVDMFYHDSEHSYENMIREYEIVWPSLRDGGALVSDDVDWNPSFQHFALQHGRMVYYSPTKTRAVVFK